MADGERRLDDKEAGIDNDTGREIGRKVIAANAAAVAAVSKTLDGDFMAVVRRFARCRGKVIVTGSGTSGSIAQRAAHLLSVGGTPAFFLHPADGLHGGLGAVGPQDIVLALTKGGGSAELNAFCSGARERAEALVVLTANPGAELASRAEHVLALHLDEDGDLGGIIATASSLAAASLTDALVEVVRVERGYGFAEVLATHPAGAVGQMASTSRRAAEPE